MRSAALHLLKKNIITVVVTCAIMRVVTTTLSTMYSSEKFCWLVDSAALFIWHTAAQQSDAQQMGIEVGVGQVDQAR